MPGARLLLEERGGMALGIARGIALGIALGRSLSGIARGVLAVRSRTCHARSPGSVSGAVNGRWNRGGRHADVRAARRRVVSRTTGSSPGRSSGACGCVTRRTRLAKRLRLEHPDEPHWWVSHETTYQAHYLQGRGGLRAELTDALRTGRARRRRKGPNPGRGARGELKDSVSISERPAEAADRAAAGHWEDDLILGR